MGKHNGKSLATDGYRLTVCNSAEGLEDFVELEAVPAGTPLASRQWDVDDGEPIAIRQSCHETLEDVKNELLANDADKPLWKQTCAFGNVEPTADLVKEMVNTRQVAKFSEVHRTPLDNPARKEGEPHGFKVSAEEYSKLGGVVPVDFKSELKPYAPKRDRFKQSQSALSASVPTSDGTSVGFGE